MAGGLFDFCPPAKHRPRLNVRTDMQLLVTAAAYSSCALSAFPPMVAWVPLDGSPQEMVTRTTGTLVGDASMVRAQTGAGANFFGKNGAVLFKDSRQFELGPSFSVSATVMARALPQDGSSPAGQIVFRGDERCGLDNFSLNLGNDGFYTFYFNSASGEGAALRAPSRIGAWQTLLGTSDAQTKDMCLYVDGALVGQTSANLLPITLLDVGAAPGFSIGNVQNPLGGCHNQPFNGQIKDVRLYNSRVFWDDLLRVSSNG